jgi:hypothetical protein
VRQTTCGFCGAELGRTKIYDVRRNLYFCSNLCVYRFFGVLDLWWRILQG